jgi:hypothetical protein
MNCIIKAMIRKYFPNPFVVTRPQAVTICKRDIERVILDAIGVVNTALRIFDHKNLGGT